MRRSRKFRQGRGSYDKVFFNNSTYFTDNYDLWGPSSANRWQADDGHTVNAGWIALWFSWGSGLEVIKLEYNLKLKIKRNDWLLSDTCPQARLLKELSKEIAPFLCIIYQKCLETGSIPDVWRTANVSAIYKKGEKFKASNYRPVSLTCISCKMFEHIIVSNIMRHLDTNNILTDCQHGFRPRRSCENQLITLVDELVKSLNKGNNMT